MFQTKAVEKIKTHILYSVTFLKKIVQFMRYCAKNMVEPDRPQIWRMCIACWIPKATDTHNM